MYIILSNASSSKESKCQKMHVKVKQVKNKTEMIAVMLTKPYLLIA